MVMQSRIYEQNCNDLIIADDITLLENDATQAQLQLDARKQNASQVGLEINIYKTVQMCLNVNDQICNDILTVNGQPIAIVDDFKYLGSYIGSNNKDIKVRISLTWSAFAKLKPILTSPKPAVNFEIRLFKASCTSILHYGCKARVLAQALTAKLEKFARKCY